MVLALFLYRYLLNKNAVISSKPSGKSMTSTNPTTFDKPELLKHLIHKSQSKQNVSNTYHWGISWCYGNSEAISKKKVWEFTRKKIKNSKIPYNTNLDRRQPLSKTQSQENLTEKTQVMHWHKTSIKSEIWHWLGGMPPQQGSHGANSNSDQFDIG